jgi:type IV fimbrial biogenesis protein FimT
MTVVAVLAIASAAALPHLIEWRHGMRLRAAVNELRSDLAAAKARAARENADVTVYFSPAEGRYRITLSAPGGSEVALKHQALPPGIRLSHNFGNDRTVFRSRGTTQGGTLVLQNEKGKTIQIVLNFLGRIDVRS